MLTFFFFFFLIIDILIHNDVHGQPILKITDFGLARVVDPEAPLLTTRCGSEEYTAPEIVQSKGYDGRKTDTWSLGVILYALLVGYLPFRYDTRKHERVSQLFYRIVRAEVKWPSSANISHDAKEVVSRILEGDPEKRIELSQVEKLPWFSTL
jgi:serine/threonine protein kinase